MKKANQFNNSILNTARKQNLEENESMKLVQGVFCRFSPSPPPLVKVW